MLIRKRLIKRATILSPLIRAIAHRYRLAILYLLAFDERETWEIADTLMIAEPLAVHHLERMVASGWVKRVRTGRRVTYSLQKDAAVALKRFLADTPFFRVLGADERIRTSTHRFTKAPLIR